MVGSKGLSMKACKIFISYSHADEWLKDELVSHFGALKRNGLVDVWHDRRIPPGGLLNEEIDANLGYSDLCLFLISADFINSEYCFHKEYQEGPSSAGQQVRRKSSLSSFAHATGTTVVCGVSMPYREMVCP